MVDLRNMPDDFMRTGHFIFQVRRRAGGAWNWRLRVEAVDSGVCGVFESMQDALWFMRAHMVIDADIETHGAPEQTSEERAWLDQPIDSLEPGE
jgi:hypothetical protein